MSRERNRVFDLLYLSHYFFLVILSEIVTGLEHGEKGSNVQQVVVKEDSDVLLPCSLGTEENIVQELFDWMKDGQKEVFLYEAGIHYNNGRAGQDVQFKGRVSHFKDELKHGNASIIIRAAKVPDSGNYTCAFPRLQPPRQTAITLVVEPILKDRSHEITDAAPKPFITVADVTELSVQLRCDIRGGFPQPELIWMDGDQRVLPADEPQVSEREGRYDVTLQTTVTASTTNRFRCVATQLMIGHMTDAEIAVSEKLFGHRDTCSRQLVVGWICGVSIGVLMSLAALLLLRALKRARCLHYQTSVQREHCPFEKKRPHENMDLTEKWPRPETKNKAEVPTLLL